MKNKYKIIGKHTIIYIEKDKNIYEIKIDTEDFPRINFIKNYWNISFVGNKSYVKAIVVENNETVYISLSKVILNIKNKEHIKFLNGNRFDFRKSNLFTLKDLQPNKYELRKNGDVEIILSDYENKEKARTIIDINDLEKILQYKYRWKYSIINGCPCVYSNSENGNKKYIEHIILDTNKLVKHINNNNLDNRKSNLTISRNIKTKNRKKGKTVSNKNDIPKLSNKKDFFKKEVKKEKIQEINNKDFYNYSKDEQFDFKF